MEYVKQVKVPSHGDDRGNLSVLELKDIIDWVPKRLYYLTDVTGARGAHAVKGEKKIYICMKGSCKARFNDGQSWYEFLLKGPEDAIVMDGFCWRDFTDFSGDAVLCILSNMNYEKEKYLYDFDDFLAAANSQS